MAGDEVAVDPEVAAAVASHVEGPAGMNVARRCAELGISRTMFYKYVRRFREQGVRGFYPDSRRPQHSPDRLDPEAEDLLVAVRKREADTGWDYGADAILLRLREDPHLWSPGRPLPSRSTVNRVLEARGQLQKVPQRRPRPKPRRFERERVNELWQFDGFECPLPGGRKAVVLHLSDDCSRVDLALHAVTSENGAAVWDTFCAAVADYGLPAAVLNDNGTAFSGRRRGWTSRFEAKLGALGVEPITSRVNHPQTCGKNERGHQRVRKWLAKQPPPADQSELQALLDRYREGFNNRGNRVLGGLTPYQRYTLGPLARPADYLEAITHITSHTVSARGAIGIDKTLIGLGRAHAGKTATAFRNGDLVTVFVGDKMARQLVIDRSRHYQPVSRR